MGIPTKLPEWASDLAADIVEPSQGQKEDGWDVDDKPPAGWLNWKANLVYQWVQWISKIQVKNWLRTDASSGLTSGRLGLGWGLGYWMALGTNATSQMQASKDGYQFLDVTMPGTEDYYDADSDGTYAVAVGNNGSIAWATNVVGSWTANNHGSDPLRSVRYGNGVWVAVGLGGDLWTATDPTGTWTKNTSVPPDAGSEDLHAVLYIEDLDLWVAVGEKSGGFSGIMTSTDPPGTWTEQTNPLTSAFFLGVAWDGQKIIAVGGVNNTRGDCAVSINGTSWTDKSSDLPEDNDWVPGVAADPFGHVVIYVDLQVPPKLSRIFLSDDSADTWDGVSAGIDILSTGVDVHYSEDASQFLVMGDDAGERSLRV